MFVLYNVLYMYMHGVNIYLLYLVCMSSVSVVFSVSAVFKQYRSFKAF